MSDMMFFPASWEDFLREYSFKDKEEIYTNGADLISVFRVRQMMEHYHHDWISVKDRLPDDDGKYIVWRKGKLDICEFNTNSQTFGYTYYDETYSPSAGWDDGINEKITHWTYFPEPPKENNNE